MKEEALKLANELDALHQYVPSEAPAMIRRLVEELDKAETLIQAHQIRPRGKSWFGLSKPLSDEEIWELHQEHIDEIPCGHSMKTIGFVEFVRAIEERHGIK